MQQLASTMDRTIGGPAITGNTRTATIVLTKTKKVEGWFHSSFEQLIRLIYYSNL